MARVVVGILAADLVLLISGFVVRTTNAPLVASIVLSFVVTAIIIHGLVKRFREEEGLISDDVEIEEFEVDEATETRAFTTAEMAPIPRKPTPRKPPPRKEPAASRKAAGRKKPAPKPKSKPKAAPRSKPTAPPGSKRVFVVPGASRYHRMGCRFAGENAIDVSEATAIRRGYDPCGVCKPESG